MRKVFLLLILASLAGAGRVRAQGYTDAFLTSINYNTAFPCGNTGTGPTQQLQFALENASHYSGGTVDATCYQTAITLSADIFSPVSAKILLYLPEHPVTVNANATIPSNFELCGGPGASIAAGVGFTLTNNSTKCFNGFTGGGGGAPGAPSGSLQFNNGGVFGGVPHSDVNATSGDITLGSGIFSTSTDGQYLGDAGTVGITLDATGGGSGSGPLNLTSSGSISLTDNSAGGMTLTENGAGGIAIEDAADFIATSAGGFTVRDTSSSGLGIVEEGTGNIFIGTASGIIASVSGTGGITMDATGRDFGGGGTGPLNFVSVGGINFNPLPFASLPACVEGNVQPITDSPVNTFDAIISAGGGTYHGIAYCNGTNWTFH